LGMDACRTLSQAAAGIPHRIVLVTPAARHELSALQETGYSGYLVKPVRASSLAARVGAAGAFHRAGEDSAASQFERARGPAIARGMSILVAEDNEINALLARALITKLGHYPTIASSGAAAVEAWSAARAAGSPYGLILMDVHMPGSDGLEAASRIR